MQDLITSQYGAVNLMVRSPNDSASLASVQSFVSAYQGPGIAVNLS